MNAISPGLRRYSVKPASSPSTRISKRWRPGSSTTATSGALVAAIREILAHCLDPRDNQRAWDGGSRLPANYLGSFTLGRAMAVQRPPAFRGRTSELEALDRLLENVR